MVLKLTDIVVIMTRDCLKYIFFSSNSSSLSSSIHGQGWERDGWGGVEGGCPTRAVGVNLSALTALTTSVSGVCSGGVSALYIISGASWLRHAGRYWWYLVSSTFL